MYSESIVFVNFSWNVYMSSLKKLVLLLLLMHKENEINANNSCMALNLNTFLLNFVKLPVSCLGSLGRSADSFIDMCNDLSI